MGSQIIDDFVKESKCLQSHELCFDSSSCLSVYEKSVEITLYASNFEEFAKSIHVLIETVYARIYSHRYAEMIGLKLLYDMCYVGHLDLNIERSMSLYASSLHHHPAIDYAMRLYRAIQYGHYRQFTKLVRKANPLQATLVTRAIPRMQERTMYVCRAAYLSLPIDVLQEFLDMSDISTCTDYIMKHCPSSVRVEHAVVYFQPRSKEEKEEKMT
jgi:hypothetical protein